MEKFAKLRNEIKAHGVDAYIQPVHDQWMSEYPPACNRRVEWLTGFCGSAGTVAVTLDKVALFVDGRYTLQAAHQVDKHFEIHNIADLSPAQWLKGLRVGYDPMLYTKAMRSRMEKFVTLVAVENLVDKIWGERPGAPDSPVFIHEEKYSGQAAGEKRARIAAEIKKAGADAVVLSAPESVNWLLNIRGRDVENTPLALAPAIVDAVGEVQLFLDAARVDAKVAAHLGNHVQLRSPAELEQGLAALAGKKVMVDPQGVPLWYMDILQQAGAELVEAADPCVLPKATKNAVEIAGIRRAHIRDGAAIVKLLHWLEAQTSPSELDIVATLFSLRKQNELFVEPSFDTIAGSGANGAIVHYRATESTNRRLQKGELLLLDSGGQYVDGTTDITRTVAFGAASAEQKDRFTRVLKGHIAIATAQFPKGTVGSQLDSLARQYLWSAGLDYDHGTGHGVGCFLGVHEGPQRISKRGGDAALAPGMVVSNEPGYYKEGEYGIRIENLVTVVRVSDTFLGFETLTCAPIDISLIEVSLLTQTEKEWLNHYHIWVQEQLSPLLSGEQAAWLAAACKPIA